MLFLPYPPVGKATSRTPDSAQARNRNHRALKLVGLLAAGAGATGTGDAAGGGREQA